MHRRERHLIETLQARVKRLSQTIEQRSLKQTMNAPRKRQLFEGSLLDQNSTLESLIKWIAISAMVLVTLWQLKGYLNTLSAPKTSIKTGCEVPAYLMSKRFIPEPYEMGTEPTYRDMMVWYEDRIEQLETTQINLINDRNELRSLCQ